MNFLLDGLQFRNIEKQRADLLSVKKKVNPCAYVSILQNQAKQQHNSHKSSKQSEQEYRKANGIYISDNNLVTIKYLADLQERYKISNQIMNNISKLGWKQLTFVQQALVPSMLEENSNIVVAATGSGKTGAYLIPTAVLLDKASQNTSKQFDIDIQVIIITLTQTLQEQVQTVAQNLVQNNNMDKLFILSASQLNKSQHLFYKQNCRYYVIIDEFDEVFQQYEILINNFVQKMIEEKKVISLQCLSATKNPKAVYLAEAVTAAAVQIEIGVLKTLTHRFVYSRDEHKMMNLQLLLTEIQKPVIIFCDKQNIQHVQQALYKHSVYVIGNNDETEAHKTRQQTYNNKQSKNQAPNDQVSQNEIIRLFNAGKVDILVATDFVSRGVDFYNTETIIHFDQPSNWQQYMHRCGRAGRQKYGLAISLYNDRTRKQIYNNIVDILKEQGQEIIGWNDEQDTRGKREKHFK